MHTDKMKSSGSNHHLHPQSIPMLTLSHISLLYIIIFDWIEIRPYERSIHF